MEQPRARVDPKGMRTRRPSLNPTRWIAGATGLTGLLCLILILREEGVDMAQVYASSTLFVGGTLIFVKRSMSPYRWERTVNGPEARRFLAIGLGITSLMLLAGVIVLVGWIFRTGG